MERCQILNLGFVKAECLISVHMNSGVVVQAATFLSVMLFTCDDEVRLKKRMAVDPGISATLSRAVDSVKLHDHASTIFWMYLDLDPVDDELTTVTSRSKLVTRRLRDQCDRAVDRSRCRQGNARLNPLHSLAVLDISSSVP